MSKYTVIGPTVSIVGKGRYTQWKKAKKKKKLWTIIGGINIDS